MSNLLFRQNQKNGHYDMDGMPPPRRNARSARYSDKDVNIGIKAENRKMIVDRMSVVLADTYCLYLKTQNFHWNVTGENFYSTHLLFEKQYKELAEQVDLIAERIRALGFRAPATFSEFVDLSSISEEQTAPNALEMIEILLAGYEVAIQSTEQAYPFAEKFKDISSSDLLCKLTEAFQKSAWMLRSHLGIKSNADQLL